MSAVGVSMGACASDERPTAGTTTAPSVADDDTTGTTEVPVEDGIQLDVYTPSVGDCFDRRKSTDGSSRTFILKLPCDKPHTFEVFAVVPIEETQHPGEATLADRARKACPKAWESYVGEPYETSELELSWELPSRGTWGLTLAHSLGCLLRSSDEKGKLAGSKRGSGE